MSYFNFFFLSKTGNRIYANQRWTNWICMKPTNSLAFHVCSPVSSPVLSRLCSRDRHNKRSTKSRCWQWRLRWVNVSRQTRNELNLFLKPDRPIRSYRDCLLTSWQASWLAGWQIEYPTGRLTDCPTSWLSLWLTDWLTDWLAVRLADWLTSWLADWLTDCLTDWLTHWRTD